jgi:H/ACA ribonucleoprotein complex subunit 2
VVKALRKGSKGYESLLFLEERLTETRIVIIAGDISPIDVISHVPVLCEEADVPYAYVPSKEELGQAGSTKRPTSVVMIVPGKEGDFKEAYDEIRKEFKEVCIFIGNGLTRQ